ncbi:Lipase_GDSL domain-containing protein [Psidium guajava]|nr:Lipase_GDSL domain-containing protein [Psidium guajava]
MCKWSKSNLVTPRYTSNVAAASPGNALASAVVEVADWMFSVCLRWWGDDEEEGLECTEVALLRAVGGLRRIWEGVVRAELELVAEAEDLVR